VTERPAGYVRECCVRADLRRRVAEERADSALAALGRIQRSRNLESARDLAQHAILQDGCLWRMDETLKKEQQEAAKAQILSEVRESLVPVKIKGVTGA